ncbi:hypothetical protein FQN53_003332 [Emmonsiellopsis sp. PD_33]|nr:hypothetical protein FQN53_003332 [Emmonsiellopsis sp. PD_33]
MKFTTTALAALSLLSALPTPVMANSPCNPGEIAVGWTMMCLTTRLGGQQCRTTADLSSHDCHNIDTSPDEEGYCDGGWHRGTVNCAPDGGVWNVQIDGKTYGSYPTDGHAGCYEPAHGDCGGGGPFGQARIDWNSRSLKEPEPIVDKEEFVVDSTVDI